MKTINNYILEKLHLKKGMSTSKNNVEIALYDIDWTKIKFNTDSEHKHIKTKLPAAIYNCSINNVIDFLGEPSGLYKYIFGNTFFSTYVWAFKNDDLICMISCETPKSPDNKQYFTININKSNYNKDDIIKISSLIDTLNKLKLNNDNMKDGMITNNIGKRI